MTYPQSVNIIHRMRAAMFIIQPTISPNILKVRAQGGQRGIVTHLLPKGGSPAWR